MVAGRGRGGLLRRLIRPLQLRAQRLRIDEGGLSFVTPIRFSIGILYINENGEGELQKALVPAAP
jgi:hypothetical protein